MIEQEIKKVYQGSTLVLTYGARDVRISYQKENDWFYIVSDGFQLRKMVERDPNVVFRKIRSYLNRGFQIVEPEDESSKALWIR